MQNVRGSNVCYGPNSKHDGNEAKQNDATAKLNPNCIMAKFGFAYY